MSARFVAVVDTVMRGDLERSFNDALYSFRVLMTQYHGALCLVLAGEAATLARALPLPSHDDWDQALDDPALLLRRNLAALVNEGATIYVLEPAPVPDDRPITPGITPLSTVQLAALLAEVGGMLFL
ncbi:hypothetical protein HMPREF1531_00983 [Propionibacterium sp. oral taxon 192 str. F0372]|uniref:hypothetical protein n=1 Tax=Propionibacterium sp. oral taxon 192 TaxID=671222 RepID=UPI0003531763|nr:hypothetical protein [Propionibacterium sp. oral taxon 192]EPH05554.1 hypothetical protein HMPREF1531_00983 [Propionibacterium sp. oral taxon 192 str. F0372]